MLPKGHYDWLPDGTGIYPIGTVPPQVHARHLRWSIRHTKEKFDLEASDAQIAKAMVAAQLIRDAVRAVVRAA